MISPVALWARGIVNSRTVHLVETEDGVPRRLDLPGGPAWEGVCGVVTPPRVAGPEAAGGPPCQRCAVIDAELRPLGPSVTPLSA